MDRRLFAGSVISAAIGLVMATRALTGQSQAMQDLIKDPQAVTAHRMPRPANQLEK